MNLVEVGRYDRNEAHMVAAFLEGEGIDSVVFDGGASIADGSWLLIPVRVMVGEDDLATARAALATTR